MSELRWHPLLREWVVVAAHRQGRPQMPADWCPFCPGSGRVPEGYDVYLYQNDFAALSLNGPPFDPEPGLFKSTGAKGVCDVVLYHPSHYLAPSQLSVEQWRKVIDVWTSRSEELSRIPDIAYVYVFENTGLAIGVTMPHPHGQIYAFPFIPPLVQRELDASSEFHVASQGCLYCRLLEGEEADGRRLIARQGGFVAFVPFAARWPAEVHIYPHRHCASLADLSELDRDDLAGLISIVRRKYDNLFGFPMPLMMIVRQAPAKGEHPYFHLHIEFCPIQRDQNKIKYLAGVESGGGTFLNDTEAEERAACLRATEPTGDLD
jgi:UDPglucose--hexose-1-phosphate uridylyltransferase